MSSEKLFSPLKVGAITAANRVFMAPLTRLRSIEPGDIPTPLMAEYYRQRASAGLIISEATQIPPRRKAMPEHPAYIAKRKLPHGRKSLLPYTLSKVILLSSCGTPDASLTPVCSQTVKLQLHLPRLALEPAPRCAMKTAWQRVRIPQCRVRWKLKKFPASLMTSVRRLPMRAKRVSIWLNCTLPTATCCTVPVANV